MIKFSNLSQTENADAKMIQNNSNLPWKYYEMMLRLRTGKEQPTPLKYSIFQLLALEHHKLLTVHATWKMAFLLMNYNTK